jgi:hypothetical protein
MLTFFLSSKHTCDRRRHLKFWREGGRDPLGELQALEPLFQGVRIAQLSPLAFNKICIVSRDTERQRGALQYRCTRVNKYGAINQM